jgi:hypothetical protein
LSIRQRDLATASCSTRAAPRERTSWRSRAPRYPAPSSPIPPVTSPVSAVLTLTPRVIQGGGRRDLPPASSARRAISPPLQAR